ncbi:hypothetical protein H4582DRAFT_1941261 [Lactarius indigo]|nr:hypothetical protein H4582DRAFT_1941261 [Lactarius indigo]
MSALLSAWSMRWTSLSPPGSGTVPAEEACNPGPSMTLFAIVGPAVFCGQRRDDGKRNFHDSVAPLRAAPAPYSQRPLPHCHSARPVSAVAGVESWRT